MRISTAAILLSTTLIVLGLSLAPTLAEEPVAAEPAAPVLPAITVSTVEARDMRDIVLASGLIGAVERVQVQPLIEGQPIEELLADVGDKVTEGQVLARLSISTLELQKSQYIASRESAKATIAQSEAQILEARSSADEAQRVSERTQKLKAQGSASQAAADTAQATAISATARVTVAAQSLEAARAQLSLVEAQLANVELQLQRAEVKAPVAGEIVARNAQVGSIASAASAAMFEIVKDGALELRAEVPESDLLRVKDGQSVSIMIVGASEPLTGTVHLVEPQIDQITRLGTARIRIDQSDKVRAGMFAEARILTAQEEGLAVPVTAVGTGTEGASVMEVTDGKVTKVAVTTGIRDAGYIEILDGLTAGDVIVTKAGAFVRDGDRINPVSDTATTN